MCHLICIALVNLPSHSWGMGTNGQLGTGGEDDLEEPAKMRSKALACRAVFAASSGGQHTVLIATNRERTEAE